MPNTPSLKNRRVYEALRRKGMSKRSAARISNAQKAAGAIGLAIPPTGTHALFNQPGIASRRRKRRKAACSCGIVTKATGQPGELIEPGVRRIRGNLCNVHGRYGPCDAGASSKKPKGGKKPPKPKQTPEQRAAARTQQRQANSANVAQQMADNDSGLSPSGSKALLAFATGEQPDSATGAGLAKMGLAEQASDGTYRMTPTGRAVVSAMAAGDYQRAVDAVSRGTDASAKRGERTAAQQTRQDAAKKRQQDAAGKRAAGQLDRALGARQRAAQAAKPKPASGGKKPVAHETAPATPRAAKPARRASRSSAPKIGGGGSSSKKPAPKPAALDKVPAKQVAPALRDAATQLSEGGTPTDEQMQALITNGLVKLNKDGVPVLTAAGQRVTTKEAPSVFSVFKDARGRERWLGITTTAYLDVDDEIISTKAIGQTVAIGDLTQQRGPLRYWHVPGLDIGDCDYQAQGGPGGRFLIESGTFRSKGCARLGQKMAEKGYQMSPGFVHARSQPRHGIYDDIALYERSPVPQGRAANRFTKFATKEDRMLTTEKEAELKTLLADQPDLLNQLMAQVERTDKAAQAIGVTYKDAPEWAQSLITRIDGIEATVKAFTPPAAADAPEVEIKADEFVDEEEVIEEPADEGGMDDAAFAQMIAQAVVQAITPLFDIEKKMAGHLNDFKTAMGGAMQQKDDAAAAEKTRVDALEAKLKELSGDLPSSVLAGASQLYRASESPLTRLTAEGESKVKEGLTQIPAGLSDPAEVGAYQLIFGNQ